MQLKLGRIVAVHPSSHTVDATFPSDGRRINNIRVMSMSASSHSGSMDLPSPSIGKGKRDPGGRRLGDREMQGIFGMINDSFVCLGFLFPQDSQMMQGEANCSITRHVSGVYTAIDGDGNVDIVHPSGAYVRIGSGTSPKSLSGANGNWNVPSKAAGTITVKQAGGKASLTIDPSGKVELMAESEIIAESQSEITLKAQAINYEMGGTSMRLDNGNAVIDTTDITFTGNARINGNLYVDGDTDVDGDVKASGTIKEKQGV